MINWCMKQVDVNDDTITKSDRQLPKEIEEYDCEAYMVEVTGALVPYIFYI